MSRPAVLILGALLLVTPAAVAQASQPSQSVQPSPFDMPVGLQWLLHGPLDAGLAVLLAGLAGAIVALFPFLGGTVPGTFGSAELQKREATLFVDLEAAKKGTHPLGKAFLEELTKQRRDLDREKRVQFGIAALLYLAVGVLGSLLFANNFYEGFAIGLGGPAALGTLLKSRADRAVADFKTDLTTEARDALAGRTAGAPAAPAPDAMTMRRGQPTGHRQPPAPTDAEQDAERKLQIAKELGRRGRR